ncbi:MAG TPA: type 1 glutamine amidotransferase domain-containing protein [Bdellovibrionales bacterium]|nr:type 1 glutamine amidotransferase domain-containing protein [Bdellovibrionales bacterium]
MFLVFLFSFMVADANAADHAKSVLVPLPAYGFDPTESGVPWTYLKQSGFKVIFATPDGKPARADVRMLTGQDLGVWKKILMNDANGARAYREMEASPEFQQPLTYGEIESSAFDALLLPGGHDKGMRPYLESLILQKVVSEFFEAGKPVGAICHGTLLAARSLSPRSGRSVLWGRKTTGLTKRQEMAAYYMTKTYLGDYYRTYPTAMADEVKSFLASPADFDPGPELIMPSRRDSPSDLRPGFTVLDGNYISARWPGDAHRFGSEFAALVGRSAGRL